LLRLFEETGQATLRTDAPPEPRADGADSR
jgi:hypothetical protein